MMSINIVTINGVDEGRRGLLIISKKYEQIDKIRIYFTDNGYNKSNKIARAEISDRLLLDMDDIYKEMLMIKKHFDLFEMNLDF